MRNIVSMMVPLSVFHMIQVKWFQSFNPFSLDFFSSVHFYCTSFKMHIFLDVELIIARKLKRWQFCSLLFCGKKSSSCWGILIYTYVCSRHISLSCPASDLPSSYTHDLLGIYIWSQPDWWDYALRIIDKWEWCLSADTASLNSSISSWNSLLSGAHMTYLSRRRCRTVSQRHHIVLWCGERDQGRSYVSIFSSATTKRSSSVIACKLRVWWYILLSNVKCWQCKAPNMSSTLIPLEFPMLMAYSGS